MGNYFKKIRRVFSAPGLIYKSYNQNNQILRAIDSEKILLGKLLIGELKKRGFPSEIQEAEFSVFSQWGEDGILQHLISQVQIPIRKFVEFGVENYREANTRFLLLNNNWSGLVMEADRENTERIKKDGVFWKFDLTVKRAFVTAENINSVLESAGYTGEIGLLSIDIDGNDYWVWKAIRVIEPAIVIVEYNSLFGNEREITIPYDPKFNRYQAHYSGLYQGASLAALCSLAEAKGYAFVGSNSVGVNAFFVRRDRLGSLKALTSKEGYVCSRVRESKDRSGNQDYLAGEARLDVIKGLPVFNVKTGQLEPL